MRESLFGVRVVPAYPRYNGIAFDGFEGIIIHPVCGSFDDIEIIKMVWKNEGYFADKFERIPYEKTFEHSKKSGKHKLDFLVAEAKKLAENNEEIAITDELVPNLVLLEESWKIFRKK